MPRVQEKTKEKTRGFGRYESYIPWIAASEFSSVGTTAEFSDWKHKRTIQCLSDGEKQLYYILRWKDAVDDINEQYPLPIEDTKEICKKLGIKHPGGDERHMTSDFLVWLKDGSRRVYSIKASWKDVRAELCASEKEKAIAERNIRHLAVEKYYWEEYEKVPWRLVVKEDLDHDYAENIRRAVLYYNLDDVHDRTSAIKYLVATKQIVVDLHEKEFDFNLLASDNEVQKALEKLGW